ncbi:uncharacterized protein LOC124491640 [Dermatophagoides farinae]|uniref:uncharacterized protein LOC124491640 n=1 Tax=Dermatophagoides farinae TaxID=6954 RepID=UPI003F6022A4
MLNLQNRMAILVVLLSVIHIIYGAPRNVDDLDDSRTIIFSQVPMNNLVRKCLENIPLKYRERCLRESFEQYAGSLYPQKTRCCTKWSQMECLTKYTYNTIYCDIHQQQNVHRYFNQIRSTSADGSPECVDYRPIEEEVRNWSSDLGRVPKCAANVELEFLENIRENHNDEHQYDEQSEPQQQ